MNATPPTSSVDLLERRLTELSRRKRNTARLLVLLPTLAVVLAVAAAVIVGVRLGLPEAEDAAPWIAGGALLLPLLVAPFLGRVRLRRAQLAAEIDTLADARGLAMGLAAEPAATRDERWTSRLRRPLEEITWPRRDWSKLPLVGLAAAAVIAALLLPQRYPDPVVPPPPWQAHFERTKSRLEAAETHGVLPHDEAERLAKQVERLEAHAGKSGMSQAAWDGLDRVDRDLDRAIADARARLAEAIAAAQTTDQPRANDPPPGTPGFEAAEAERRRRDRDRLKKKNPETPEGAAEQQAAERKRLLERLTRDREDERLQQLAKSLSGLAEAAPGLLERLDSATQEALRQAMEQANALDQLSPEAREALERMLRQAAQQAGQQGESGQEGQGGQQGSGEGQQLDPEALAKALKALEKALEEGAGQLGQLGGPGGEGGEGEGEGMAGLQRMIARLRAGLVAPGAGVSRGPGSVALTQGAHPGAEATPGEVGALPPGAKETPDGSITLAVTSRDPDLDPAALEALSRGALENHDPANADARRVHIAPRHRGAVSRYFGDDD